MRWIAVAVFMTAAVALMPSPACAAEQTVTIEARTPSAPTPFQAAAIGLCLTAVAVVGARVIKSSQNTMMYMVLAALAITATLVAYSDRVHSDFVKAGIKTAQNESLKTGN